MKKSIMFIIVLLLFAGLVSGASPFNFLTKAFADTLYCHFDGTNCPLNVTVNLTLAGGKEGSPPYLFNDSTFMFFNESKLNMTIDARSGGGGGGGGINESFTNNTYLRLDTKNNPLLNTLIINNSALNITTNTSVVHSMFMNEGWFNFKIG